MPDEFYYPPNPQDQAIPAPLPPPVKVRYDDPSVIKYLVENKDFLDGFSKWIRGWGQLPNMATGELEWMDTKKPLINERGALWLTSRVAVATDKMSYLTFYETNRIKPVLSTDLDVIAELLASNLEQFELTAESALAIMDMVRTLIDVSLRRPLGDKERKHIFGAVDESVSKRPNEGHGLLGGLLSRF